MKKRIFKVEFQYRIQAGGTYKTKSEVISVLAENEFEAKKKLMGTIDFKLSYVGEAKEVVLT